MIEIYSHLHERSNQSPQIVNPQVRIMGKHRTEQSGTDNQVIVWFHLFKKKYYDMLSTKTARS